MNSAAVCDGFRSDSGHVPSYFPYSPTRLLVVLVAEDVVNLAAGGEATQMTGMSGLRTLRIVRITRLVKVARLARVLRFIMALRTLTQSILHTMKSLIWAMVLLSLVVYTFAVLFTQVVNDHLELHEGNMTQEVEDAARTYFRSLPQAGFSSCFRMF